MFNADSDFKVFGIDDLEYAASWARVLLKQGGLSLEENEAGEWAHVVAPGGCALLTVSAGGGYVNAIAPGIDATPTRFPTLAAALLDYHYPNAGQRSAIERARTSLEHRRHTIGGAPQPEDAEDRQ